MKKIEILDDMWIKQIVFENESNFSLHYKVLKIESISGWNTSVFKFNGRLRHWINIYGSNANFGLDILYEENEARQYQEDLLAIESLLLKIE